MIFGRVLAVATTAVIATGLGAVLAGVRLNVTASMPVGLYLEGAPTAARGALVLACPDLGSHASQVAIRRGYYPVGNCPGGVAPMLKRVAAVPGDLVELLPEGLALNGTVIEGTRPMPADRAGRALPRDYPNRYVIESGSVLLLGESVASFDGRYLGPTKVTQIRASARPIF